jgi:hypothetical protein
MRNEAQTQEFMRQDYQQMKSLGIPQLASNNQLVLDAFPNVSLLFQNFVHPINTNTESTEVALAGGLKTWVPGVPKTNFTSPITLVETREGALIDLSEQLMAFAGSSLDGWSYYGRKEKHTRKFRWFGCQITFENGIEAAADGNAQVSVMQGTINFNYFGQNPNIGG